MRRTKAGEVRPGVDVFYDKSHPIVAGAIPTDGVQYSAIATFGTTNVDILSKLVDPGYPLELQFLEVGLTQSFTELLSATGSLTYYWRARSEHVNPQGTKVTGSYVNLTGTYQKGLTTGQTLTDTFSGYLDVGSIPYAPVRFVLTAVGLSAATMSAKVKNSSYVRMVGVVIPGA